MVSNFGKFMRKIRIDRNESLRTMAQNLEISAAFLSAMEVGRKNIPIEYIEKIVTIYNLDDIKKIELENSIYETNNKVQLELNIMNEAQKDVSLLFARKIKTADDKLIELLREALLNEENKSN